MGAKASNNFQSDRPESGGADKDMLREKSGLPDIDKERFAQQQAEQAREGAPKQHPQGHDEFSVGSPRNPEK